MLYSQRVKVAEVNVDLCKVKQEVCFVTATERQVIECLVERFGWFIGGDGALNPGSDTSIRLAARIDVHMRAEAGQ